MGSFEDYYETLQVHRLAEPEVIEAAYKKLAQKYHPDVNKSPSAMEKMKRINIAHDILCDPVKRKQYDFEWLRRKESPQRPAEAKPSSSMGDTRRRAPAKDIVPPFTLYYCRKCKMNTICFNRQKNRYECSKCRRHWNKLTDIK